MIVGKVRISYPALFEPKLNPSGKLKYSCSLLIPKADEKLVSQIRAGIDKAIARGKEKIWSGKVPRFRNEPMRDGDAELESGEKTGKEYAGHYFINCSSDEAPGIVGPDGKPLMDQKTIYAGCYVYADVNPFPFSNSGNHGVGWGLNNVMFKEPGDRLDGRQDAQTAFADFVDPDDPSDPTIEGNGDPETDIV